MPVYDFKSRECNEEFSVRTAASGLDKDAVPKCPACGAENAQQLLTLFSAKTSRKD